MNIFRVRALHARRKTLVFIIRYATYGVNAKYFPVLFRRVGVVPKVCIFVKGRFKNAKNGGIYIQKRLIFPSLRVKEGTRGAQSVVMLHKNARFGGRFAQNPRFSVCYTTLVLTLLKPRGGKMKNLYCAKEHSRKRVLLTERSARIGDEKITYCLSVALGEPCLFLVTVKGENGVGVVKALGADLDGASRIFELLVKHAVAPCHVREIVDDLLGP